MKRVGRTWRSGGLKVQARQSKRSRPCLSDGSCLRLRPERPGHVWSYDVVEHRTHKGRNYRLIPKDFFLRSTTFGYFSRLPDEGLFGQINYALVMADRARAGREASPTAIVLDIQNVKTTESGGQRGYDAGKKVKGCKRQALVDTDERALVLDLQAAHIQDRDGAGPVLHLLRRTFPFIVKVFADASYAINRSATA